MDEAVAYRIARVTGSAELAEVTARLLDQLPSWFGMPEANVGYVEAAKRLPGLVAYAGAEAVRWRRPTTCGRATRA
ncbi:hypothetical protein ACI2LC_04845 [Nonomuraea wenchangensis]|uniref:hypothetical protein n=1 Tax=Nonomuraea wenchangensis TaxID=568860 RepID=UPI0038504E96